MNKVIISIFALTFSYSAFAASSADFLCQNKDKTISITKNNLIEISKDIKSLNRISISSNKEKYNFLWLDENLSIDYKSSNGALSNFKVLKIIKSKFLIDATGVAECTPFQTVKVITLNARINKSLVTLACTENYIDDGDCD